MDCCRVSRRDALRWAGIAAATPLVLGGVEGAAAPATASAASTSDLLVTDLEVVTVTDTGVILTWFTGSATQQDRYGRPNPVATDTEVLFGPAGSTTLTTVLHDQTPTPYHYAEVTGLQPGTPYSFAARSAGVAANYSSLQFPGTAGSTDAPYTVTTLTPPPGKYLFTVALSNDWHHGEETSGIIVGNFPPAFQQDPGLPPYTEVMAQATLSDLRQADRAANVLLVAGDLTAEAAATDAQRIKQLLDGFGQQGRDYLVARGNHDRPHVGATYDSCTVVPSAPDHHDCWGDVFGYRRQQLNTGEIGGLRLIGLDTTTLDDADGQIEPQQFAALTEALRLDKDQPTLVFGHHPITWESAVTTAAGPGFDLDRTDAQTLESVYAKHPGVFFHHSGHTHRNKRTTVEPGRPGSSVEFLEVAATKEYPGGYTLLRVHSGGYQVNFYKTRGELARQWSQRTRGEYFGLYPHYTLGTIADRNHVVAHDLSGLRAV